MKRVIIFAAALLLLGGGLACAGTYAENWDTDPGAQFGGWTDDPDGGINHVAWLADGGVGNSGHLVMSRPELSYPPYFCPSLDPAKSGTAGDVNGVFGDLVNISYDIYIEDGDPPDNIGYGWWLFDTAGGLWYTNLYLPGTAPFMYGPNDTPEWAHISVDFDTTWSNAEANAAGFYQWGATSSSWVGLMSDLKTWNFGGRALNYSGGGPYTIHMDNFVMVSVPEPSSIALLAGGFLGLMGLFRRRR